MLRERTQAVHLQAERTGAVGDILRGRASRAVYVLFLRNLLPAYRALERGLESRRGVPGVTAFARPALYRVAGLESDLRGLCGPGWRRELPVLPAGRRYARRIARVAAGDGTRLIGHAYARYLGDLSGGQILARLLARSLGLGPATLAFYAFPQIPDADACKDELRAALDRAAALLPDPEAVLDEAMRAFRFNIALSQAVKEAAADRGTGLVVAV